LKNRLFNLLILLGILHTDLKVLHTFSEYIPEKRKQDSGKCKPENQGCLLLPGVQLLIRIYYYQVYFG